MSIILCAFFTLCTVLSVMDRELTWAFIFLAAAAVAAVISVGSPS